MSNALQAETLALSIDLHALLCKVDTAAFREEFEAEARAQLDRIVSRVRALLSSSAGAPDAPLHAQLDGVLSATQRALDDAPAAPRAFWSRFLREVHPAYEALAASLRSAHMVAPSLRPTNYGRNVFHALSALVGMAVLAVAPGQAWIIAGAAAFFTAAWTMEIARRHSPQTNERLMRFFGPVAHVHERFRVNSATWYATALMALALTTRPAVAAVAVAVLGFADPAAALVGRRFGRVRLRTGRSLEGTLAFFATAFVAAFATLAALHPMGGVARVVCAGAAALAGALAELYSTRVDDNLSIPLAVAASVALAARLLGVG